jgi:uncharacterized protein YdgA (DUF945 family)
MSKALPLVIGAVVILGAATAGVAWYTGTQAEPLLRQQVVDANRELKLALAGYPLSMSLELPEYQRHLFTSSARYVATLQSPDFNGGEPFQVHSTVDIEHGPFPWSRVKQLKWLPVMAAANARVEGNGVLSGLLGVPVEQSPLQARSTLTYGRELDSQFQMLPGQWQGPGGTLKFAGIEGTQRGSLDGEKTEVEARTDSIEYQANDAEHPVTLQMQGVKIHSGGIKGVSGFYLGNSALQIDRMSASAPDRSLFQLDKLTAEGSLEELKGALKGSGDYRFEQLTVAGRPIGSGQMRGLFENLDIEASRNLMKFYQEVVAPQAAAASQANRPLALQLSPQQQADWQANAQRLLDGHPHIALQPLGLKTANGESHLNVSFDLTKPANPDLPPALLAQQMITNLDAKLSVAKGTIRDLVTVQGQLGGMTDAAALAENAEGAANLAVTMATLQGLASVEGENIVSSLRYEGGRVDFNGQKLTVAQFVAFLMGALGRG